MGRVEAAAARANAVLAILHGVDAGPAGDALVTAMGAVFQLYGEDVRAEAAKVLLGNLASCIAGGDAGRAAQYLAVAERAVLGGEARH